jgi:hypothetical protein
VSFGKKEFMEQPVEMRWLVRGNGSMGVVWARKLMVNGWWLIAGPEAGFFGIADGCRELMVNGWWLIAGPEAGFCVMADGCRELMVNGWWLIAGPEAGFFGIADGW